ncbi:hypothetical protein GGR51DRAFT_355506 [Nemania sp. FL0031]|nr:hypothetical protein GGR51DRAFT_355506 [Nemania sp. FL0031]
MRARGPLWTLPLAAGFAIASATSIPRNRIFERADTCAADFTKCTQSELPANFCCKTGSTCNVLAGGTTVLCCPSGSDCATIQTISCTLSLQDPAKNPTAAVKTTELSGKLPTCGTGCCPFGYHCDDGNGNCVMDADQSKKPGQTSTTTTTTSGSPTSTASKGAATHTSSAATSAATQSTATSGANAGETAAPSTEGSTTAKKTLNTAAIVGGVVGALLAISLLIAGFCLFRHKRRKGSDSTAAAAKKRETTQSFGHIITRDIISAPIPHEDYYNQRLDFLAKTQGSEASSSPTLGQHDHDHDQHQFQHQQQEQHFQPSSPYSASVFRNSTLTTAGVNGESEGESGRPRSHHASAEVGGLRNLTDRYSSGSVRNPFTPRGEHFHSGGSQSINIFADPSTVGSPSVYNPRDTTWTEFAGHHYTVDQEGLNSPLPPRK